MLINGFILRCSVAELGMIVARFSSVALFKPFCHTEVTQSQSHRAVSGYTEEASVFGLAKQRTTRSKEGHMKGSAILFKIDLFQESGLVFHKEAGLMVQ